MKNRLLFLTALLVLLLSACTSADGSGDYLLYFPNTSYLEGSALGTQPMTLPEDAVPEEALIAALLGGPTADGLKSPFPSGVTLHSWSLKEGVLHINLSEQYGGLSGVRLTLADASIALTLCQLDHVEGVSITVANDPLPYRYRQVLTPQDILIPS